MLEKKVITLEEIVHNLQIIFEGSYDVIAYFSVVLTMRPIGDDYVDYLPTITELDKGMTNEERIRLAKAIIELGKRIHKSATRRLNDE